MSTTKKNAKKFGAYCCDENGIAVRCFNRKSACWSWIDKHWPELNQEEKARRIWTFSSRSKLKRFFDRQIELGCTDKDVLACMTYWCGCATKDGLDLKAGKIKMVTKNLAC